MISRTSSLALGIIAMMLMFSPVRATEFEPPPPGSHFRGPAVIGSVVLEQAGELMADIDFMGRCKGTAVNVSLQAVNLGKNVADITRQDMTGIVLQGAGVLVSNATNGACGTSPDLVIQSVHAFNNMGDTLTADIIMVFLVPGNNPQ